MIRVIAQSVSTDIRGREEGEIDSGLVDVESEDNVGCAGCDNDDDGACVGGDDVKGIGDDEDDGDVNASSWDAILIIEV